MDEATTTKDQKEETWHEDCEANDNNDDKDDGNVRDKQTVEEDNGNREDSSVDLKERNKRKASSSQWKDFSSEVADVDGNYEEQSKRLKTSASESATLSPSKKTPVTKATITPRKRGRPSKDDTIESLKEEVVYLRKANEQAKRQHETDSQLLKKANFGLKDRAKEVKQLKKQVKELIEFRDKHLKAMEKSKTEVESKLINESLDLRTKNLKLQETLDKMDKSQQSWRKKATELQKEVNKLNTTLRKYSKKKANGDDGTISSNAVQAHVKKMQSKHHEEMKELRKTSRTYKRQLESEQTWNNWVFELLKYKEEHGHCNVPQKYARLGPWVLHQRNFYRTGKLSEARRDKLEYLGIKWNIHKYRGGETLEQRMEKLGTLPGRNDKNISNNNNTNTATSPPVAESINNSRSGSTGESSTTSTQQHSLKEARATAAASTTDITSKKKLSQQQTQPHGHEDEEDSNGPDNDDENETYQVGGAASGLLGFYQFR